MELGIQSAWLVMMPKAFFLVILILGGAIYARRNGGRFSEFLQKIGMWRLIIAAIGFRVAYAILLTILQYYAWAAGGLGKFFLHESLNKSLSIPFVQSLPWIFGSEKGYFIFYSFLHFWINAILSVLVAWLFYRFLILLKKHKERFFDIYEVELGFVMALAVGWPAFVIFVPMIFVFVVLASVFRLAVFKEAYTTLGWPFILAALISIAFGGFLLQLFHLSVLSI